MRPPHPKPRERLPGAHALCPLMLGVWWAGWDSGEMFWWPGRVGAAVSLLQRLCMLPRDRMWPVQGWRASLGLGDLCPRGIAAELMGGI